MFDRRSRYRDLPDLQYEQGDGRRVAYKARRFLPRGDELPVIGSLEVRQGDRPDLIAYRAYDDATLFWRLCDANDAMNPFDLVAVPGRRLRVPYPD